MVVISNPIYLSKIKMGKVITGLLLLLGFSCIWGLPLRADVVVLTSGERFNSSKIWEEKDKIRLDLQGLVVSIKKTDVAEIIRNEGTSNAFAPHSAPVKPSPIPPPAHMDSTRTRSPIAQPEPAPFNQHTSAFKTLRIHGTGLDGVVWMMKPSQIPDIKKLETDPAYGGIDQYGRPGELLTFGDVLLDGLVFGFWRDQLYSIMIWVNGRPGYDRLNEAVTHRYGQGNRNSKGLERYVWIDDTTDRLLEFDEKLNTGIFWMRSRQLDQIVKKQYPQE